MADEQEEVKCLPQVAEVAQKIPEGVGVNCTGTYTIETPLLVSTWEPESVVVTVVSEKTGCSGTQTSVDGTKVQVQFGGSGGGGTCNTVYLHTATVTAACLGGITGTSTTNACSTIGVPLSATIVNGARNPNTGLTTSVAVNITTNSASGTSSGCIGTPCSPDAYIDSIGGYSIGNVRKQNPADPDCERTVTVRYEGCSKGAPPGTYGGGSPPPGGGSSGGGGSPGGSPPTAEPPPSPPPQPPSGGFGGGNGGGGSPPPPSGNNPPPPDVAPPPTFSQNVAQPSGSQLIYPGNVILTPAPEPEFPPLFVILPGGEPEQIPWNGYNVFPGSPTPGSVVVGAAYPALYVSPMMAQRVFHNWKTLKHVLLQFDNRLGTEIHTALTTNDAAQYGKAFHKFNASVGIIYNDEFSDEVIQELYRYDPALWGGNLFLKHYSPKQVDSVVSFKEALLGTSYSYQVAVYSSDANTWKLVGWQIEGKPKGKRRTHSRD